MTVGNPKPITGVDRSRLYDAAPELLEIVRYLAMRFELELDEQGANATFPGRALLIDMQRAIAVADGLQISYDALPPRVSESYGVSGAPESGAPISSATVAARLADETIGLFLEYRDNHGFSEVEARTATIRDVAEGASVNVREALDSETTVQVVCEVEDCARPALRCGCGNAHCGEHPHQQ